MDQSRTQELSVDEALSHANSALRKGDLNLASTLFNAVVAHDNSNAAANFGKHKIEFLINELTGENNPYTYALQGQNINNPEDANAAIKALDRALQSLSSQRESNTSFREGEIHQTNTSHFYGSEEAELGGQDQHESPISHFDREGFCVIRNIIKPDRI